VSKKKSTDWLIEKSKSIFGDQFDYSNTIYIDAKSKIHFRCKVHGISFSQTSNNHFISKFPCPLCKAKNDRNRYSLTLNEFKKRVFSIHGDVFDFNKAYYINNSTPIKLICKFHKLEIDRPPTSFLNGHGCPKCQQEKERSKRSVETLKSINKYVEKLGGLCVSKNYKSSKTDLLFRCKNGHEFYESWSDIKHVMRWCPKCSRNKLIGESLARQILEHLLSIKLPSTFIPELNGLQLDGYHKSKKIAFEYQGYQHFTEDSHFHQKSARFQAQLERDELKKKLCQKNDITLIEIFEFKTIRANRIELFVEDVKSILNEIGLKYTKKPFEIDLFDLYHGKKSDLYDRAKKVVEKKGGKIQEYVGAESFHKYQCKINHTIRGRNLAVIIKSNASCPHCDKDQKFQKLKSKIEDRRGTLVDKKIKPKGLGALYKWKCENGHVSNTKGSYILQGSWCKSCQIDSFKVKFNESTMIALIEDIEGGRLYQKEIFKKYDISNTALQRIIKENKLNENYRLQDRKTQVKKTKGRLFQIDSETLKVIRTFESLQAVKQYKDGIFKPEGIRGQMKKYRKAYGYYWCREFKYEETQEILKNKK
jgi:hypothetical protein